MGAIADLWKSERGLVAIALLAAATIGLGLGRLTTEQWLDFSKWVFVTYAAAKTITGSMSLLKGGDAAASTAPATPAQPMVVRAPSAGLIQSPLLIAITVFSIGIGAVGATGYLLSGCAATKADVTALANGTLDCAKADMPAVRALGLRLGTEALAGALTGDVPWSALESEAEAAAKDQGLEVAACAFGGLIADISTLLAKPPSAVARVGTTTPMRTASAVDPLGGGGQAIALFKTRVGVKWIATPTGTI